MTSRNLSLLGVVAVAVFAAALWLANPRTSEPTSDLLYPGLKTDLTKVTVIRIFKAGDAPAVGLTRGDSHWQVSERANYPADMAKIRKLLQALAEAKTVEEKTSNPESYATLGVEDVSTASATGVRVEVVGATKPVNLIVGKSAGMNGSYVRRVGEPASWLTNESIEASSTPHDWLQSSVLDVSADRVQSATVTIAGAKPWTAAKAARADADFKVEGLPKGKQPETFAVNGIASALANLTLADVRPAQDFASDKPAAHATFKTFDGLVVDLDGWTKDGKHYLAAKSAFDSAQAERFKVEAKPAEGAQAAKAESIEESSGQLNARLAGSAYEIADYKYEAIFKTAESLAKK